MNKSRVAYCLICLLMLFIQAWYERHMTRMACKYILCSLYCFNLFWQTIVIECKKNSSLQIKDRIDEKRRQCTYLPSYDSNLPALVRQCLNANFQCLGRESRDRWSQVYILTILNSFSLWERMTWTLPYWICGRAHYKFFV